MNPDEYMEEVVRLERDTKDRFAHAVLGAGSEAGELADLLKKEMTAGEDVQPWRVLEECGDELYYIAQALEIYGYTFEQCMRSNIAKLQRRHHHGKNKQVEENSILRREIHKPVSRYEKRR